MSTEFDPQRAGAHGSASTTASARSGMSGSWAPVVATVGTVAAIVTILQFSLDELPTPPKPTAATFALLGVLMGGLLMHLHERKIPAIRLITILTILLPGTDLGGHPVDVSPWFRIAVTLTIMALVAGKELTGRSPFTPTTA